MFKKYGRKLKWSKDEKRTRNAQFAEREGGDRLPSSA